MLSNFNCGYSYRFLKNDSFKRSLKVQVIDHGELTIEFYSSQALEKENLLCRLEMDLPPPTTDTEVSISIVKFSL